RALAREIVGADRFLEVHCNAPLATCEARDTDGLFRRARAGEIEQVTGIDAPYEAPAAPALALATGTETVAASLARLWALLEGRGLL
ncbi:MAG TPA: adenylyl-sulfate kinase, partial [Thermoanaerobaculia bacterium]|nr:adenylyl-sulfate kinase [Thermoanaerobaculia bacterium]